MRDVLAAASQGGKTGHVVVHTQVGAVADGRRAVTLGFLVSSCLKDVGSAWVAGVAFRVAHHGFGGRDSLVDRGYAARAGVVRHGRKHGFYSRDVTRAAQGVAKRQRARVAEVVVPQTVTAVLRAPLVGAWPTRQRALGVVKD